jgi:hypothetical protein
MKFTLSFTESAVLTLKNLKKNPSSQRQYKAVAKALKYLETNPRHPSLETHPYHSLKGPNGEKVFEAYAQQNTPAAYRIFFFYTNNKAEITITSIIKHPGK